MRVSGNAIDIVGGHEDANHFNPAQHVLLERRLREHSAEQIIEVMREQHKEGSDFAKIYETGPDRMIDGVLHTRRINTPRRNWPPRSRKQTDWEPFVGVHAMGEPGTLYAAQAGVASIDHATQFSDETMRLMREKGIFAVPTFTIFDFFATHNRVTLHQAAS
jgi:hypothetical protein